MFREDKLDGEPFREERWPLWVKAANGPLVIGIIDYAPILYVVFPVGEGSTKNGSRL